MSLQKMLGQLHEELAQKLLQTVRDPESKASELNVVRQFLKDNDITALPTDNNALQQLLNELPFDENNTGIQ